MLPVRRTFEGEKRHLQELNGRLAQYLSRTTQLEQENARLIAEIKQLRQAKGREPRLADETRDLRRTVAQLRFEKTAAETEREKLWRELQTVQALCGEQTEASRGIGGELRVCEEELHHAHKANGELQRCLFQLERECKCAEDAHRQELEHLRRQVESRMAPVTAPAHRGPPAASAEELRGFASGPSGGWIDTFEMYQRKVDDMEQAMKEDRATLGDLQREKMLCVSELEELRAEAERRGEITMHLEEQLAQMQEKFQVDCGHYQRIIEELEHERNMMADTMEEKMREHQHLLQVKMDLGTEVAAYRALLGGERVGLQDGQRRMSQHQRERVIDIRMPSQPYTPRASTSTTRQQMDVRYPQPTSNLRRSPVPPSRPISSSRVIPISFVGRAQHQSPASRRDMVSFSKAQAASSAPPITSATTAEGKQTGQRENQMTPNVPDTTKIEKTVEIKLVSQTENRMTPNVPEKREIEKTEEIKQVSQTENQMTPNVPETTEIEKTVETKLVSQTENQMTPNVPETTEIEKTVETKLVSQTENRMTPNVPETTEIEKTVETKLVSQTENRMTPNVPENREIEKTEEIKQVSQTENQMTPNVPGTREIEKTVEIKQVSLIENQMTPNVPETTEIEKSMEIKQVSLIENQMTLNVPETTEIEKSVEIKQVSLIENQVAPIKSSTTETKSVRVVSPPTMMSMNTETESEKQVSDEKETDSDYRDKVKDEEKTQSTEGPSEKKILDSVSVEEIIMKAIKPAGLEAKVCSSGESKMRYHIEETEQEDGTMKMRIVLESKVEEEVDISEDSALDELLSQGAKTVSLEDIKDTQTGSMIKNLLSGLQRRDDLENKSVSVEIIEEPVESHSDEEPGVEQKSVSSFCEPPTTYFQIEELENVPHDTPFLRSDGEVMETSMTVITDTDHSKSGSVQVQEVSREGESSYFSHPQEPHEYFVSSPDDDDNLSEPEEECGGITSYGHYGILDDLSDERYYEDDGSPSRGVTVEDCDEYKFLSGDHSFVKESFPECIMEEEVRVSPVVQESVLELLREDSLEPREQLRGALEKLQSSMSGPLREELAFLAQVSRESPQNVSVDVKKVQQSSDNGTTTIIAELNVSQTLEDSGLLEAGEDLSEEQFLTALRSSNLGRERAFQDGARGEYSFTVSKEEDVAYGAKFEGFPNNREYASEISERHMKLETSEKSFTFKMDMQDSLAEAVPEQELQTTMKISHEQRIATVYLESPTDD